MSESGRETAVSARKWGVLTQGFLRHRDGVVKTMKLNAAPNPMNAMCNNGSTGLMRNGTFKANRNADSRQPFSPPLLPPSKSRMASHVSVTITSLPSVVLMMHLTSASTSLFGL
jgi:hypothetical protein